MDSRGDVWERFRRDLPGLALLWVAVTAIAVVLQTIDGRGTTNPIAIVLAMTLMGLALTPLVWIRHEIPLLRDRRHPARRATAVVGFGCLWTVVVLLGGFFVLTLLGVQ